MILYSLRCARGHDFEGWFRTAADFDEQAEAGAVGCPLCGDADVRKALMAPRLSKGAPEEPAASETDAAPPPSESKSVANVPHARIGRMLAEIRTYVEENCEHVGDRFAEEARRIHYGESEARGIYGDATDEQAKELAEEDIPVARLPWPRRDA